MKIGGLLLASLAEMLVTLGRTQVGHSFQV